ncbi:MAG: type II secretion system protein GspN [Bdellovibrio sp.]|nr:type II secretion system protein GspN [Bdellovibrio sp.]
MMNGIVRFFRFLLKHKWKILLTCTLTVWFLVLLFPFNDLNDTVSAQVSRLTNNRVFIQFDKLSLNPFSTSLTLNKVFVETPQISTLTADSISVSPSLSALISQKPGGTLKAEGFLKGDVEIHLKPVPKSESGIEKSKIDFAGKNINLKDLREMAGLSLPIKGKLQINSQAIADLTFAEQPEVDLSMIIQNFELPPSSIALNDLGRMNLPEIKLGMIELKGKLASGKFIIETGKIGTAKDEFFGDIKGDLGMTFQNMNGQVIPIFGAYNISLDMKATRGFKERAKFFLGFLDGYKSELPGGGATYKFKIQAAAAGMTPQFTPLR